MRDLKSNIDIVQSIVPAVYSAAQNGTGADLQGFNSAMVEFFSGVDVGSTHAPSVEESDTLGSGYTAVAAADLIGSLPADIQANEVHRVGYKGNKRFIRAVVTSGGASLAYGANIIRGNPDNRPLA